MPWRMLLVGHDFAARCRTKPGNEFGSRRANSRTVISGSPLTCGLTISRRHAPQAQKRVCSVPTPILEKDVAMPDVPAGDVAGAREALAAVRVRMEVPLAAGVQS